MAHDSITRLLSEKNKPCLSVIIPQHRLSRERMQNPEILRKAMRKGKSVLKRSEYPASFTQPLIHKLEELAAKLKPEYGPEGLGFFVSPDVAEMVLFPFAVKEKIVLDSSFITRELLCLNELLSACYVLVLSKKDIRLFSARGDQFAEIKDDNFPMVYEEEYEYARSSQGSSYGYALKAFEKDKSILSKMRTDSFYKEGGSRIATYLNQTDFPLLVAGTAKQVTTFKSATGMADKIAGEVTGSFSDKNFFDLRARVWSGFAKYRQREAQNKVAELYEKNTLGKLAKGIQEVWEAAREGRGHVLFVEKDYTHRAYLCHDDPVLYLRPPKGKYSSVPDAVDEIIETVIAKGGQVIFMEANMLKHFDYIALMLRY